MLHDLAAEYAAIYLTGAYQASPYESVWTDDEHLMCQASMFTLRKKYADAGSNQDWQAIADFLDQHLLAWYPKFVTLIAQRSQNQFYVMLNLLTAAWAQSLRTAIAL